MRKLVVFNIFLISIFTNFSFANTWNDRLIEISTIRKEANRLWDTDGPKNGPKSIKLFNQVANDLDQLFIDIYNNHFRMHDVFEIEEIITLYNITHDIAELFGKYFDPMERTNGTLKKVSHITLDDPSKTTLKISEKFYTYSIYILEITLPRKLELLPFYTVSRNAAFYQYQNALANLRNLYFKRATVRLCMAEFRAENFIINIAHVGNHEQLTFLNNEFDLVKFYTHDFKYAEQLNPTHAEQNAEALARTDRLLTLLEYLAAQIRPKK